MESDFLIAILTMGGLGFIFAGGLAIADKKLRVEENPMIGKINDILPGANCGACGYAGCYDFAVNLVEGKAPVTGCPVGGEDTTIEIASMMGLEAGSAVKMYPRILCYGGQKEAIQKIAHYYGPLNCSAMEIVSGGNKLCNYGCLGGGDCVTACPFGAMIMGDDMLPQVVEELCTGCGLCVKACPRNIIEMHPEDREVFVFCKNHDDPKTAKNLCSAACIGCGICARGSDGAIRMDRFLPVIDYDKLNPDIIPYEKCKTNAIKRINTKVEA